MYGAGYVWIVIGPSMMFGHLIFDATDDMSCTVAELKEASDGYFVLNYYVVSRSDTVTISGKVIYLVSLVSSYFYVMPSPNAESKL